MDVPTRVPEIETKPEPEELPTTEDFSQILIEKSKLKPEILKDFDAGLDLPNRGDDEEEDFNEEFADEEFVPATTLKPRLLVNLTQLLSIPSTKEMIEDHIMDMIIENPERAAADLSELFDIQNEDEKETTEEELFEMMEEDPLAVTSAFTDLIMAQKEEPSLSISTSTSPEAVSPTTPFEPVKIEQVPEAVKGQMQRMTMKPPQKETTTTTTTTTSLKPLEVSTDLLNDMMRLIEEGQLSHKEVIEELINNGVLPVEVTDIGRIPIIVGGGSSRIINEKVLPDVVKSQPLLLRKMPKSNRLPAKPREEVNLDRLQQLRVTKPQMIMRDEHHIIQEVGLDDPDGDFEMVKLPPRRKSPPPQAPVPFLPHQDFQGKNRGPKKNEESEIETEEKDIEILSSMMELYDQGLISDEELEQMVIMMESEGVLDVDLAELGIEQTDEEEEDDDNDGNRYRAYGLSSNDGSGEGPSVGHAPTPFFNGQTIRPFVVGLEPQKSPPPSKAVSYAHFSMQTVKKPPTTSPLPPELPPPSTSGLHKAPYFDSDLKVVDHFEHQFKKTNLDFKPKELPPPSFPSPPLEEVRSGPNPEIGIRPGPAPPYYLAARLPAPPTFHRNPPTTTLTQSPFLINEKDPFKLGPEPEFDSIFLQRRPSGELGPREPFPPPPELKRHIVHQPLPLVLARHHGTGYQHPHFDIPSSLIDPKAYMKSLKTPSSPLGSDHPHHHGLHGLHPSNQFLPRKGRLNYDVFQTTLRSKRKINNHNQKTKTTPIYNPPVTGYSQVDRKFDEIRQSYIRGDSLGSGASHFET